VCVCLCAANNQNCSQMDSGIADVCTLPLDRTMMHSRFMENGHLSKVVPVKPPAVERFPIKVEDLEDYVMSRRNNNNEELRNEYRVRIVDYHGGKPVYPSVCLSVCLSVFRTISRKTDAARITKLDIQMFHDESWKSIYFALKGQDHDNEIIAVMGLCILVSAGFY